MERWSIGKMARVDQRTGNMGASHKGMVPMGEEGLPTREDISRLPRLARVAYAARCARRAFPLVKRKWPEIPDKDLAAIESAISIAEDAASAAAAYATVTSASATADACKSYAGGAASVASLAAYRATNEAGYDAYAAYAGTATCADAAACAAYAAAATASASASAVTFAADAAIYAAGADVPIAAIARDYQVILELSQREKWTDKTPVPPSVFGPFDVVVNVGAAKLTLTTFAPTVSVEPIAPPLRLIFEKGVFDPSEMAEIIGHLSELYRSLGGDRLIIDDIGTLYPEQTPITNTVPEGEGVLV